MAGFGFWTASGSRTKGSTDDWDDSILDEFAEELEDEVEPLVLDPEARIKAIERRTQNGNGAEETFAQFADRVGAQGLGELLEAAAAYSGQVQGIPEFSRPHIMKQVSELTNDRYGREDGLRAFGILLRQGKMEKQKRGIFVLTDRSRFVETNRLAGE